jgi:ABC-type Fe3+-citrate transport system substrate-binding protein
MANAAHKASKVLKALKVPPGSMALMARRGSKEHKAIKVSVVWKVLKALKVHKATVAKKGRRVLKARKAIKVYKVSKALQALQASKVPQAVMVPMVSKVFPDHKAPRVH